MSCRGYLRFGDGVEKAVFSVRTDGVVQLWPVTVAKHAPKAVNEWFVAEIAKWPELSGKGLESPLFHLERELKSEEHFKRFKTLFVELKENLRIRIHDLKPADPTDSDFSNEFSDNHGDTQLTESRIDCLSCILGQDAPDEDYQLPEDAKFCRHFLPEYWQTKGFDRGWGDAAVMNWPHLEILVRRDLGDSDEGARFIILAPYSARRPVEIYTSDPYAHGSY